MYFEVMCMVFSDFEVCWFVIDLYMLIMDWGVEFEFGVQLDFFWCLGCDLVFEFVGFWIGGFVQVLFNI